MPVILWFFWAYLAIGGGMFFFAMWGEQDLGVKELAIIFGLFLLCWPTILRDAIRARKDKD